MTKIARIAPVYRLGDKNDFHNYRSKLILPALSKVLERVVHNKLYDFLEKFKSRLNTDVCLKLAM